MNIFIAILSVVYLICLRIGFNRLQYKDPHKVEEIVIHINKLLFTNHHHPHNIDDCVISDTYKYYHPDSVEDLHVYSNLRLPDATHESHSTALFVVPNAKHSTICIFQKSSQLIIPYQLLSLQLSGQQDTCYNFSSGYKLDHLEDYQGSDIEFTGYLLIASTNRLLMHEKVRVTDGNLVYLDELSMQYNLQPISLAIKIFAAKVVKHLHPKLPKDAKLFKLLRMRYKLQDQLLRVISIEVVNEHVDDNTDSDIMNDALPLLHELIKHRYQRITNIIDALLRKMRYKRLTLQQSLTVEIDKHILKEFHDADVYHTAPFFLLADYNRFGDRVYNFLKFEC